MDWGNCIMRSVETGAGAAVTAIAGELHLQGDFKKTKLKLTWLADVPDVVPLRLVTLGYLITKAKVRLPAARPPLIPAVDLELLQQTRVSFAHGTAWHEGHRRHGTRLPLCVAQGLHPRAWAQAPGTCNIRI